MCIRDSSNTFPTVYFFQEEDNLHVDIFYFPRGRHSFPPKFHFIPPKNFFFPTWKIKILHLDISKYPRGNPFFPK